MHASNPDLIVALAARFEASGRGHDLLQQPDPVWGGVRQAQEIAPTFQTCGHGARGGLLYWLIPNV